MCDPRSNLIVRLDRPVPVPPPSSSPLLPARPRIAPDRQPGADPTADRMLEAAQRGSNRAWAAMVERLDPTARALAHLVLGGRQVDTVLLAAYVRAYRARRRGGPDATAFLLHHVWTACGHELRRRQRRQDPAPGRRAQRDDLSPRLGEGALARRIATLRPEERAVWALVERQGRPPALVARVLGVDVGIITGVAHHVATRLVEAAAPSSPSEGAPVVDDSGADLDGDGHQGGTSGEGDAAADGGALDPEPPDAAFWAELGRQLRAERETLPAATARALPEPGGPSPSLTPAKAPPMAMQRRAPAKVRRSRPDLVEELADEADRQRPRRDVAAFARRAAAVLVVLAVVAGAVALLYRAASSARSPVRGPSTADVAARSMEVLGAGTWSATVDATGRDDDGQQIDTTYRLTAASDGSYRLEDVATNRLITYDAGFGVLRESGPGLVPIDETGVAFGPPDPSAPRAGLPLDELATAARALVDTDQSEPRSATVDGQRVLRLTGALDGEGEVTYTVDAGTLVPVRLTWIGDGRRQRDLVFRDVTLDEANPAFTQDLAADRPAAVDRGFVPVPISDISARIGLTPLTPDQLPGDAFSFTGAAIDDEARIASLRYARGPQQITVTLRPSPVEAGRAWDDPFDRDGRAAPTEDVVLGSGRFRDAPAQQVSGGSALPSVWAADGELAMTVAGDVSPDDLLAVARSLR